MKWLLVLALLITLPAMAQNCQTKNLLRPVISPFNQIPVYDQGAARACYAYTSSVLANYHFIKKGAYKKVVHPIWVANVSTSPGDANGFTSGFPVHSLNAVMAQKNCSHDVVEKELQRWGKRTNLSPTDLVAFLDSFTVEANKVLGGRPAARLSQSKYKEIFKALNCKTPLVWDGLASFLEINRIISTREFMEKLILRACFTNSTYVSFPKPKFTGKFFQAEKTSVHIAQVLDTNDSPVEISYCANALYNPSYGGIVRTNNNPQKRADCQPHSSVIVGKKLVNNQCHFLLRNSWGPSFNRSNRSYKCYCRNKKTGHFADNCTAATHNTGEYTVEGCWIPATVLNNNVFGQVYIPKE